AAGPDRPGRTRAAVAVAASGKLLTLVPDQKLLRGRDTVYPVYIDPVYRDDLRTAWAMIDSGYASEEYWKFDGKDDEGLGLCPVSSGWCGNSQIKRLFYRVPTSVYAGKTILSAQFAVTLRHTWSNSGNPSGDRADLYLMSGGISTSTNWNNRPGGTKIAEADPGAPSGGSCAFNGGAYATEWSVTTELRSAASKKLGSLTFGLRNGSESDSSKWLRYCDNGHLRVHYNTLPSQPKMSNLGMTPGSGCSYDLLPTSYVNKRPTLTAYLFDADHGKTDEWGPSPGPVTEQLRPQFKLIWGANLEYSWTSPVGWAFARGSIGPPGEQRSTGYSAVMIFNLVMVVAVVVGLAYLYLAG
ncbi:MAG: DNRLRE domain-containing protein, partial [Micromonosporaceae bacterium]